MPSHRRVRLLVVAIIAMLVLTFYYSGEASRIQNQKFYRSTLEAMRAKEEAKHMKLKEKIQDTIVKPGAGAASAQVGSADIERPAVPMAKGTESKNEEMEEIPIAGRTKMTVPKVKGTQDSSLNTGGSDEKKIEEKVKEEETFEQLDAKSELNSILKRAPVIIFSKSYCPHSKRAKNILLGHYDITPAPFVVELDQHPIGPALQQLLRENTGRGTVPNVLVNGKSIGGGDDVAALDQSDELASKLRELGGKWLSEVVHKTPESALSDAQSRDVQFRSTINSNPNFDPPDIDNSTPSANSTHAVKMRYIHSEERLPIPDNVKVHIRSRVVTVEGPRGKLVKDLSHIAVTFGLPEKDVISIELHHGARKGVATLRTVRTIINNLIIGVTRGFLYKMRYVYAHFPINVNIEKNAETGGTDIEIRNFLGEKYVRRVSARPGVDIITSPNVKDELQLSGNSLEDVSQSAADIQQICRVRNKDIRKFLDGLYVSERTNIIEE
ncbi:Putative 60S ribosomal protein [Penicillium brasilianum]|uniref:Putative 60S ribosomal protein n=1 Tax=Penicillium brasilianum TaxID=104259 RepID=A0A0F7TVL3_PENBI|nr:Putative 60S ribosomal protein [Penicillium brasilianum]